MVASDAEVPDGGLQGRRVLVTLVARYAIKPGKPLARVPVALSGRGHAGARNADDPAG